jgi:type IV secretory pathway component VirB8
MKKIRGYENFDDIYKESIKFSVDDGTYFRDGFDFFISNYLAPIVDRTFFIFVSILSIFIIYFVINLILYVLPIKEEINIPIKERDLTKYFTKMTDISKNDDAETTDEDILRYLLINYVKQRETHDYKTGNINDINKKLSIIQHNSSSDVNNEFRGFMSKENTAGPYHYFGKDIDSAVEITSFKFRRVQKKDFFTKVKDYFNVNILPIAADVYYTLTIRVGDNPPRYEKRRANIEFKFVGVEQDNNEKYLPVKFSVTNYKNYMVK